MKWVKTPARLTWLITDMHDAFLDFLFQVLYIRVEWFVCSRCLRIYTSSAFEASNSSQEKSCPNEVRQKLRNFVHILPSSPHHFINIFPSSSLHCLLRVIPSCSSFPSKWERLEYSGARSFASTLHSPYFSSVEGLPRWSSEAYTMRSCVRCDFDLIISSSDEAFKFWCELRKKGCRGLASVSSDLVDPQSGWPRSAGLISQVCPRIAFLAHYYSPCFPSS